MTIKVCKVESQPRTINLDKIFIEIGEFGKFQIINYLAICVTFILVICSSFSYIFVTNDQNYRCKVAECDDIGSSNIWVPNAIPTEVNGELSKCRRYSRINRFDTSHLNCSAGMFNKSSIVVCDDFVYNTEEVNILKEFNLQCEENRWKLTFIGSLGNVAECLTLPFIGLLADRYGRSPVLIYSVLLVGVFGLAKSFAVDYLSFAILHFIGSLFGAGTFAVTFVLGAEIVGPSKRSTGAAIITNGFSIGQILLACIAMNMWNFRQLLQILYILVLVSLSYMWAVPESVRWLYSVGEYKKGFKIIRVAAKMNGSKLSDETINSLSAQMPDEKESLINKEKLDDNTPETSTKGPMMSVVMSRKMMFRLINCCYCYFTNALIFYGLSVRSIDLAGNKYINFMLAALMEIPGNLASYFVLKVVSRKWALAVSMILCGMFCVASELLGEYDDTWRLVLFLLGKCTVSFSFTVLSVYVTEMFPTNCRMRMFNICKTCAGIGNIFAPQIPLLANLVPILPMVMFGATSMTSALLVFLLPDTRHSQLPQTVADALNIGKFVP